MKYAFQENGSKKKQVDFIICGTQKGGTTALDTYLRSHPGICMANRKEVHFFDSDPCFADGQPQYDLYHSFFTPNKDQKILGESTPIYMYWHEAPKRMWQYNAALKLIVLLRNPIERAYSHWNMEFLRDADHLPFWDAIQNEPIRCREALPLQHTVYSYIDRGFYLEQLRRLWMYFPKERVLILKNEYLKKKPLEALKEVCRFLNVDQFSTIENQDVFSHPYKKEMSERERTFLRHTFEYEIKGLERVLGWDCSDWLME